MKPMTTNPRVPLLGIGLVLLSLILIPAVFDRPVVSTFFTQAVIISLLAMSYNMLLGQTGMLSFGHAVYAGLGAYCTVHFLNHYTADGLGLGIVALPIVGAVSGAFFGLVLGFISTRRSGTSFAMITLGISEMLVHLSLMMPSWSGGEAGITMDRMLSEPRMGFDLGSELQVYYYVLAWVVLAIALQYAITRTPLGRLANAVRDNPERVMFIGFNPQKIRLIVMVLSGMFAGIGGSLSAVSYEIVTSETLGLAQSGMVLIAAYLGGVGYFFGPVLGAFLYVFFLSIVASLTHAWLLYFGLLFVLVVLFCPNGLFSLARNAVEYSAQQWVRAFLAILMGMAGIVLIESVYALKESQSDASVIFGLSAPFGAAAGTALLLALMLVFTRLRVSRRVATPGTNGRNA